MFLLRPPSEESIRKFLREQASLAFSYDAVGTTATTPPHSYRIDHNRIPLGDGIDLFERAKEAVRRWAMFDLGWVKLIPPETPIEPGRSVAVLARHFGFWSLHACRIVYVIEIDSDVKGFGFAYGTLPDHAERGEERFTVEFHQQDNSVWYDILAFSTPNHLIARLGFPVTRSLQKKFALDSKSAMLRVVRL